MSDRMKVVSGVALVVVAVVLFVVLSGGDDDTEEPTGQATAPALNGGGAKQDIASALEPQSAPVIQLRDGRPVNGVQRIEVSSGERVSFTVRSDSEVELHLHGYDITRHIPAGGSALFRFPADLEGGYEVEVHGSSGETQIADLVVSPG